MISEFRRAKRRKAHDVIVVTDSMTEAVVGRIGNVSESGMLLIASAPLTEDALYQFRFQLPYPTSADTHVEVGAHLLWMDRTNAPGQAWTGFRFIAIPDDQLSKLRAWIDSPGGQYE